MLSVKRFTTLLLLLIGLVAGCGQPSTTPSQEPEDQSQAADKQEDASEKSEQVSEPVWKPETAVRALLDLIIAGEHEKATEDFTDEVAAALSADQLKTIWETLQKQTGGYQGVAGEAKVQQIQGNQVVDLLCTFKVTKLIFRVSYNEQHQVAGIFFLPAPQEPTSVDKNAPPDVELDGKDTTLYGTIDLPKGDGPFPVVLMISGSGPNDRDGNQATLKSDYLKKLAVGLSEQGIAVLRYDKRGSGKSEVGDAPLETFRFDRFVDDAVGWIAMLRKDPRFSQVAILGHSQGSLVGMLAAQRVSVDAIVSIAGAGRSIDKVLMTQLGVQLKSMPELRDHAFAVIEELAGGQTVEDYPGELDALFKPSIQGFLISWMEHDPVKVIAALEIPILIVQGTRDIQIMVEDAEALKQARPTAELVLLENMNHVLRHIATQAEQLPSYGNPDLPLDPKLVPALSQFLKKTFVEENEDR